MKPPLSAFQACFDRVRRFATFHVAKCTSEHTVQSFRRICPPRNAEKSGWNTKEWNSPSFS
jgi:hypothetical protein